MHRRPQRLLTLFILLFSIVLVLPAYSQHSPPPPGARSAPAATPPDSLTIALRAQLDLMRQNDRDLLNTIHWALGVVVAVALLLVGFGWFSNVRLYERDKAALSGELKALLRDGLSEARSGLEEATKKHYDALTSAVANEAEHAAQRVKETLTYKLDVLESDLLGIQFDALEVRARGERRAGVLRNALVAERDMVLVAVRRGWDWQTARALDLMRQDLQSVATSGGGQRIEAIVVKEIDEALGKIGSEHAVIIESIRQLLSTVARTS